MSQTKEIKERHTYVIHAVGSGLVKIGQAYDVQKRLKQLQTASPHKLELLVDINNDLEGHFHEELAEHRVQGEWFNLEGVHDWLYTTIAMMDAFPGVFDRKDYSTMDCGPAGPPPF